MKRKQNTSSRMRRKLFSISTIIALLCLTPMLVMWTSASSPPTLSLTIIDATVDFQRKGNCLQASSGTIEAGLPSEYYFNDKMEIGGVTREATYSYNALELPLSLVKEVIVHIHIAGSFRKLSVGDSADITLLEIRGCTVIGPEGEQYCVSVGYFEIPNIGKVTMTGPNTWLVEASISPSEQWSPSLCVREWPGTENENSFCIR